MDQNEATILTQGLKPISLQQRYMDTIEEGLDLVWYAAYDWDLKKAHFEEKMKEWVPEFQISEIIAV